MIHLRVVSPPDVTAAVMPMLHAEPAVLNVVVLILVGALVMRLQRRIWRPRPAAPT